MTSTDALRASTTHTKWLLVLGAVTGPLFTIAWLLEGLACADYEPMQHAISTLSLCRHGWVQNVNFIVTGLLTLALTLGLWNLLRQQDESMWSPILFGIVAIGFIGDGIFVTDPLNGHPLGTPPLPLPPTPRGSLHLFFSALIFGLPAACFVLARMFERQSERHWAVYSRLTGISFLIVYALALAGFLQVDGLVQYAGLFQRIALTVALIWMTLLVVYFRRNTPEIQAARRK